MAANTRELSALVGKEIAVQIAALPEHIRGFDTVKDDQAAAAGEKRTELMDAFRRR